MAEDKVGVHRQRKRSPADINTDISGEEGKLRVYISIVVGFLLLAVFGAAMWINFEDRMNGIDAYRTKWIIEQRNEYKKRCEDNLEKFKTLVQWTEQEHLKPRPELKVTVECVAPALNEEKPQGNTNVTQSNNH